MNEKIELLIECNSYIALFQVSAVQVSPSQLVIEVELKEDRGKCHTLELSTDLQVKGVAVTADHVALWSSKTLVVYQLSTEGLGEDARITSKTVGKCHLPVCTSISMKLIAT